MRPISWTTPLASNQVVITLFVMAAIVVLMHAGAMSSVHFSGDDVVNGVVADIMELLDYMDRVDAIELTPPPPPPHLRRQWAGPLVPVEVIDLTCDEDLNDIPVATRLDFTLIVDEIDNGGLFGSA